MRRTDEQFIGEVYRRRDKYLKKKKQRDTLLAFLIPVLIFGFFMLPAMMPAMASDKSAEPLTTVMGEPSANQSATYPPGTVIVEVTVEKENRQYSLEGSKTVDFIKETVWALNSTAQSSSATADEIFDSKRADLGEKICTFSFNTANNGVEKYTYSVYENALYDEITGAVFNLSTEQITHLKNLLNVK